MQTNAVVRCALGQCANQSELAQPCNQRRRGCRAARQPYKVPARVMRHLLAPFRLVLHFPSNSRSTTHDVPEASTTEPSTGA